MYVTLVVDPSSARLFRYDVLYHIHVHTSVSFYIGLGTFIYLLSIVNQEISDKPNKLKAGSDMA